MSMFEIKDFSGWKPYEGFAEGSGRSEKIWLISSEAEDRKIGLFKYPKINPSNQAVTSEHISEHLAHQIGDILNIKTANVDIGVYDGRVGSLSYLVKEPYEALIEGISFVTGVFPGYNSEQMFDDENQKYYCLEHIFESTDGLIKKEIWIKMMLFDYLIGNRDRHQSNWAILASYADSQRKSFNIRECPLYDNGSSLCCYVTEQEVDRFFGKDKGPIKALTDTKSKSCIRIDGNYKKLPKHSDMIRYLISNYEEAHKWAQLFIDRLTIDKIDLLLNNYSDNMLDVKKKQLIQIFLHEKIKLLKIIMEEF